MYCQKVTDLPPLTTDPNEQSVVDETWLRFLEWRVVAVNSNLCRLITTENETLTVATDVTYKDVVGRRWQRKVSPNDIPFKVVTALAIVKTAEGNLVLLPRDSGDWDYSLECPGGFIRDIYLKDGHISVDDFIKNRVARDVYLEPGMISSCTYRTTLDAKNILEHILIYEITLNINQSELEEINPYLTVLPVEYTPETHRQFTKIPLHSPSQGALEATKKL